MLWCEERCHSLTSPFQLCSFTFKTSFTFKNHDKVDQRDTNSLKQNKPAKGGVTIPLIAHKQHQSQQAHGYSETNEDYHHRLEHRIWLFHCYRYTTQKHCSLNWHVDNYNTASSATVSTTAQEDIEDLHGVTVGLHSLQWSDPEQCDDILVLILTL